MRKLKLQVQMSVDGYIAGPNGEMDWMIYDWDDELKNYVAVITEPVDCIVLGRKLAEGFIPYWAKVASNPADPEYLAGKKFTDTGKIVFTRTMVKSIWENTVLAKGDLVQEITQLKKHGGQDIIAYGGATFVSELIRHQLIDEYHLFINPVVLGDGMPIFRSIKSNQNLKLIQATTFDCGIVVLKYNTKLK